MKKFDQFFEDAEEQDFDFVFILIKGILFFQDVFVNVIKNFSNNGD